MLSNWTSCILCKGEYVEEGFISEGGGVGGPYSLHPFPRSTTCLWLSLVRVSFDKCMDSGEVNQLSFMCFVLKAIRNDNE